MRLAAGHLLSAWGNLLNGARPLLSVELTRDCPLHCAGCYARFEGHAGGASREEPRGERLVSGVLSLVARHRPLHVSLVGGEPLLRRRELDVILPALSRRGLVTMVVTSGVIPIPEEWNKIPRVVVSVSVDGLRDDHDRRRAPATYDRILRNVAGRRVNLHWTIVRDAVARDGYIEEYLDFWSRFPEVDRILVSAYTPQRFERTPEMLTPDDRLELARRLPAAKRRYPKLLMSPEVAESFIHPPPAPDRCLFARMSRAYASDLATPISPCIIGGDPDCGQCGCAVAIGLEGVAATHVAGPVRVRHLIAVTTSIASSVDRARASWGQVLHSGKTHV